MRKALCLTALLAALAVGCLAGGFGWVNAAADQVTLTPVTHLGDASAADGLTMRARAMLSRKLVWDTTCSAADPGSIQTDYTYYELGYEYPWGVDDYRVELQNYLEYGFDYQLEEAQQWGLNRALKQLYDTTAPGTESSMTVRLADYMEYYPLAVYLVGDGAQVGFGMSEAEFAESCIADGELIFVPEPDSWEGAFLAFREFFRIPVLEEETVELTLGRGEDGRMAHWGGGSTGSDAFSLNTYDYSAFAGGAIFFTFDPHTQKGDLVDTSLIPGGYGLYRLPLLTSEELEARQRNLAFLAEELEMVYPLDPNSRLVELSADKAGSALRLLTVEEDTLVLTIIDPVSYETKQRVELAEWGADWYGMDLYDGGDFLAMELPDDRLAVISIRDSGRYVAEFVVPSGSEAYDGLLRYRYFSNSGCGMDFDGQRLAVLVPAAGYYNSSCDAYLLLYDRTGMVYLGEYRSSLTTRLHSEDHACEYAGCRFLDETPLTVTWADRQYGPEG